MALTGVNASALAGGSISARLAALDRQTFGQKILLESNTLMINEKFVDDQDSDGQIVDPGTKVTLFRYKLDTEGGELEEGVETGTSGVTATAVDLTAKEFGNKIPLTAKLINCNSTREFKNGLAQLCVPLLMQDRAKVIDKFWVKMLNTLPTLIFSEKRAARTDLTSTDGLTVNTLYDLREKVVELNIPQRLHQLEDDNGEVISSRLFWVGLAHPRQVTQMKKSSDYKAANQYQGVTPFNGEAGTYEGIAWFETNNLPTIKAGTGQIWINGVNTGLTVAVPHPTLDSFVGFVYGAYCLGKKDIIATELREDTSFDMGRIQKVGWYELVARGILNPSNGLRFETSQL